MKSIIGRGNFGVVWVCIAALCLAAGVANGKTITVRLDDTGDYTTIQDVIDDSNDGDMIILVPGIYTGAGNRDLDFGGKAITVRSIDPNDPDIVAATVIDCQGGGRGFYFHSGEDANSVVSGLTITNGIAYFGGGIYCKNSSPTIHRNVIAGNYAIWDGVEIPGFGGGISCWNSSAIITGNVITHNYVDGRGGGIYASESSLILSNNIITANDAYGYVGIFSGPGWGGGISCERSSLVIVNNTISGNYAHDLPFPLEIPGEGGGIQCGNSSLTIVNTILWSDIPDEISFYGGSTITTTYSDIQGGWPGEGNIDADPCFMDADADDFHLIGYSSPCYNAGDPNYIAGPNETDIDGEARVIDGRVDMGVDELGDCMAETNPDYANWVYWEKPDCWCYRRQCRGDIDGQKLGPFWVSGNDLQLLRNAIGLLESEIWPQPWLICADLDHQKLGPFWVSGDDLTIFRQYVSKLEAQVPECGDPPDENYNFWTSP